MTLLTMREADIRLGQRPGTLANEFYKGNLADDLATFVGSKRAIPESNLATIADAMRSAGRVVGTLKQAAERGRMAQETVKKLAGDGAKLADLARPH